VGKKGRNVGRTLGGGGGLRVQENCHKRPCRGWSNWGQKVEDYWRGHDTCEDKNHGGMGSGNAACPSHGTAANARADLICYLSNGNRKITGAGQNEQRAQKMAWGEGLSDGGTRNRRTRHGGCCWGHIWKKHVYRTARSVTARGGGKLFRCGVKSET